MKAPLSWLKEFVDLPTDDPEELEAALVSLGHEVEGIDYLEPSFAGVIVAEVTEIGPHPNADKIRLCRVNTGTETLDVVCGAWNFDAGALVAYAQVGASLGSDEPFEISAREIRGVTSNGMICSAKELQLGDDHEGILVLDGLVGPDGLGKPFEEFLDLPDVVFDVSITPNRPDCMSMVGLARELAAYYGTKGRSVEVALETGGDPTSAQVVIEDSEACPRFVAQEVAGVTMGPSPLWLQLRLLAAGQRPISNVVDVTNYVMLEVGHPIHAFDLDTLADETLVIRRAAEDRTLTTLDGQERELLPDDIVVTDPTGPVALAGVMGGATTEVSDTTTRVLIEAANWHAPSIMQTAHRLGLFSEASARFQRGVDPNLSALAATRAAELVAEVAGGTAAPGLVDAYPEAVTPWTVPLDERDLHRLLGPDIPLSEASMLLEKLEFDVTEEPGSLTVSVPTRRHDVTRPADLVEEVARLRGYDSFDDVVRRGTVGALTPAQARERHLRSALVGAGLYEIQTITFIEPDDLANLGYEESDPRKRGIRISNPLREEESVLRTTLMPGLLKAVARNRDAAGVRFFEIGKVFIARPGNRDPRIPQQPDHLGIVLAGDLGAGGVHGGSRAADFYDGTGMMEVLGRTLDLDLTLTAAAAPGFHPGRTAEITLGGATLGVLGEVHPVVVAAYGLEGRIVVAELELEPLLQHRDPWQLRQPSHFPPLEFDLSFEVPRALSAGEIAATLQTAGGSMLESLSLFDEFLDLGEGRKSLAYRVVLRADDRTLSDEDMAPIREAMIASAEQMKGVSLRGSS